MQLTPHFSLDELTRSEVATRRGVPNSPNAGELRNLRRLCEDALEPARWLLATPLRVNSGYRCPSVNAWVGGKPNSAHLDGRAADFVPVDMDLRVAFHTLSESSIPFDQIILEYGSWIHLAVAREGETPRRQVLVIE